MSYTLLDKTNFKETKMRLEGGIYFNESGISQSIRAMHLQMGIMSISSENVAGFDKPGYQRKEPVVSSFSEIIGIHGLSQNVDEQVGRIMASNFPLDCAIAQKGYFQSIQEDGTIKLTRDGRFTLNEKGELVSIEGHNILSRGGDKITLPMIPDKIEDVSIKSDGSVMVYNPKTGKLEFAGIIGVVSSDGAVVTDPDIKQGYLEASNVFLEKEFFEMFPVRRNFEANRQMFMIQNSNLSRAIQELSS